MNTKFMSVTKKHRKYALSCTESSIKIRMNEIKQPFASLLNNIPKYEFTLGELHSEMNIYHAFSSEFSYYDDDIPSEKEKYMNVNRCFAMYQSCCYDLEIILNDEKQRLSNNNKSIDTSYYPTSLDDKPKTFISYGGSKSVIYPYPQVEDNESSWKD